MNHTTEFNMEAEVLAAKHALLIQSADAAIIDMGNHVKFLGMRMRVAENMLDNQDEDDVAALQILFANRMANRFQKYVHTFQKRIDAGATGKDKEWMLDDMWVMRRFIAEFRKIPGVIVVAAGY